MKLSATEKRKELTLNKSELPLKLLVTHRNIKDAWTHPQKSYFRMFYLKKIINNQKKDTNDCLKLADV